jgi:hypothetical protein
MESFSNPYQIELEVTLFFVRTVALLCSMEPFSNLYQIELELLEVVCI